MKRRGWLLLLVLPFAYAIAQSPESVEDPSVATDRAAASEVADPEQADVDGVMPEDSDSSQPAGEDADAFDPLAALEADEADDASGEVMDRFEPTERISEDRSVAFPNDI